MVLLPFGQVLPYHTRRLGSRCTLVRPVALQRSCGRCRKLAAKDGFLGDPDGIAEPRIDVSRL
jgi:hypothetical protein